MEGLDAEAESDATTIAGIAIAVAATAVDTTKTINTIRIGRTLPPCVSGATSVLHLRVARLVIGVLRSFSRNGVGGGTEVSMKSEEGCPLAAHYRTALAGCLLKGDTVGTADAIHIANTYHLFRFSVDSFLYAVIVHAEKASRHDGLYALHFINLVMMQMP